MMLRLLKGTSSQAVAAAGVLRRLCGGEGSDPSGKSLANMAALMENRSIARTFLDLLVRTKGASGSSPSQSGILTDVAEALCLLMVRKRGKEERRSLWERTLTP